MLDFFFYTSMVLFIFVCLVMILLVLIQKGRGGGLAGAFGGAGGNTAFGAKTGDVLTWATSVVFGIFLVLAVTLNRLAETRAEAASGTTIAETPVLSVPPTTLPGLEPGAPAEPVMLPPIPAPPEPSTPSTLPTAPTSTAPQS
jgi:preprotein translocase subunit SecG